MSDVSGLITLSWLLRLAWKLIMLPISIATGVAGIIRASIALGFWVTSGLLSYSLSLIGFGLTSSGSQPESPPSSPVSFSASEIAATTEAIDLMSEFEIRRNREMLSLGPEPEKGADVTQVLVRLPNGERSGRRFHCKARLQNVYDFVDCSGCLEIGSYKLATFFPRVVFGDDQLSCTLEELGLYPLASLFVVLKL